MVPDEEGAAAAGAAVASRGSAPFGSAGRSKALPPRGWGAVAATLRAFA